MYLSVLHAGSSECGLYQHSSSLAKGKDDEFFDKKTRYRNRANRPNS